MRSLLSATIALTALATPLPAAPLAFNRDVRPLLADRCFSCHGPDAAHRKGGLRLDTPEGAAAALVPGKPTASEVYQRITRSGRGKMPPEKSGKVLSTAEVDLLRRWIEQGAPYQKHWSLEPPRKPSVPAVKDTAWVGNPIDRFVLARLEEAGWRPAEEADRVSLLRRVTFDLTGLPPTVAAVDEFLNDSSPDAYERRVDQLLASPAFGERMGMYWLDLVRYADTVGYHGDQEHASGAYRDWVLEALNANLPFDTFTTEQLAGDLLPEASESQKIASGYNRILQTTHEGGAQDGEYRAKYAADRLRNLGAVWMGATLGCAECHDHKYDPYSQRDFYRLAAFFADVQEWGAFRGPDRTPTLRPPELPVLSTTDRIEAQQLDALLARLARTGESDKEALARLRKQRAALEKKRRPAMVTVSVTPRVVRVLRRGDWMDTGGEVVEPGVPEVVRPLGVKGRRATRLDLARWLTAGDHPQTARVMVNRLWYLLHGAGLSRSPEDTGSQGEWPTHPELLDWLAVEFVESGWDLKHMVRLLVRSNTYRQVSTETPKRMQRDPENRLLGRQGRARLPAEMIRDQALAVSGLLVREMGGGVARPYQPAGYYQYLNFPKRDYRADTGPQQYRRGVYTHWQRQFLHPMLKAFDAPSREECTASRPLSNTPLQALVLLNDPTFVEAARELATRALREGGTEDQGRLEWLWRTVLLRRPQERERAALTRLLGASREDYRADPASARKLLQVGLAALPAGVDAGELAAWTAVARVLLNLDETITRS